MGRPEEPRRRARAVVALAAFVLCASLLAAVAPSADANFLQDMFGKFPKEPVVKVSLSTSSLSCKLLKRCPTTTSSTTSTSTTTTTTSIPPSGDCGTVPNPDGGVWTCTFDDEFNGTALDRSKWRPQVTGRNSFDKLVECYVDSPNNISVGGGNLTLTVRKEPEPIDCNGQKQSDYTSGMVSTNPKVGGGLGQTYGRFEIRARILGAKVPGLQESFWMWPVDQQGVWPYSGEIDIAEIYHKYPDRAIPYIHYDNYTDQQVTNNYCLIDDISRYHTYVLEWTPASLKITFDGQLCIDDHWQSLLSADRHPFDTPFYLILTQALGIGTNAFDPNTTPLPASTQFDYVRVWG